MHGVKGGRYNSKCPKCNFEEEKYREIGRLVEIENKRKTEIFNAAKDLERKEQLRVTKIYYSSIDNAHTLSPYEFEVFVSNLYKKQGYTAELTSRSNDAGRDIILYKGNEKYLVECKKYSKNNKVGRPELQKFFAAVIDDKANGGFFVTTSSFTQSAKEFGNRNNIKLIDGESLAEIIKTTSNDNITIQFIRVMCKECGSIVDFKSTDSGMSKSCPNNHTVYYDGLSKYIIKHLPPLEKPVYRTYKKYRHFRRRY
jgi:restriction system protein